MQIVTLVRNPSTDSGTFGSLSIEGNDFSCVSLERPWVANQSNLSCIPLGTYTCAWKWSNSHGRNVYHVENVEGRTNIEIHSANAIFQLLGCIALGTEQCIFPAGTFPDIEVPLKGIQHSKQVVAEFESILNAEPFQLVITNLC